MKQRFVDTLVKWSKPVRIASSLMGQQPDTIPALSETLMKIASTFNFSFAGHYHIDDDNWSLVSATQNGFYFKNPKSMHSLQIQPDFKIKNQQLKQVTASLYPAIFNNPWISILKNSDFALFSPYTLPSGKEGAVLCLSRQPENSWNQHKSAHLALLVEQLALSSVSERRDAVLLQLPLYELHHQIRNGLNAIRMLLDALYAESKFSEKSAEYREHMEAQINLMADTMNKLPHG